VINEIIMLQYLKVLKQGDKQKYDNEIKSTNKQHHKEAISNNLF